MLPKIQRAEETCYRVFVTNLWLTSNENNYIKNTQKFNLNHIFRSAKRVCSERVIRFFAVTYGTAVTDARRNEYIARDREIRPFTDILNKAQCDILGDHCTRLVSLLR